MHNKHIFPLQHLGFQLEVISSFASASRKENKFNSPQTQGKHRGETDININRSVSDCIKMCCCSFFARSWMIGATLMEKLGENNSLTARSPRDLSFIYVTTLNL